MVQAAGPGGAAIHAVICSYSVLPLTRIRCESPEMSVVWIGQLVMTPPCGASAGLAARAAASASLNCALKFVHCAA